MQTDTKVKRTARLQTIFALHEPSALITALSWEGLFSKSSESASAPGGGGNVSRKAKEHEQQLRNHPVTIEHQPRECPAPTPATVASVTASTLHADLAAEVRMSPTDSVTTAAVHGSMLCVP
jgi:hypothetical protein